MTDRGFVARAMKRASDLVGSAVGLVLLAPVIGGTALLVALVDGRPILFRQVRPGLHGRPFTIVKFRTMRPWTTGEAWYRTDDVRVTRLGRILRTTSLDELPELWNVLRGDMSLVGPRPLLTAYLETYTPRQATRHDVRPGITSWAIVNGRNDLGFADRLELDAWYVEHWGLRLDIRILTATIGQVFRRSGAVAAQDVDALGFPLPAATDADGGTMVAPPAIPTPTDPRVIAVAGPAFVTDRAGLVEPAWGWSRWLVVVAIGVVAIVLTIVAAGGGIRGSDQYWYAADVDTIVRDHVLTTNTVFPVGLLGLDPRVPPPFIHNILSLYLAAVPAFLVGSFNGWLALNIAATIVTAVLIYLTARRYAARWAAVLCALAYPLLPITIWQTSQPLAEASISAFAALFVFLVAVARADARRWLAVVVAAGLLYVSRQSYLPILLLVPIGFLVARLRERTSSVGRAVVATAGLGVAVAAIVVAAQVAFGAESVHPSYARLLHTAVPGQTDNMWFNLDLSQANLTDRLPFDVGLLIPKLTGHLAEQLVAFDSVPAAVFYWTFNLLAIVAVVAAWRYRRTTRLRVVIAALAFVAIHVMTIALFQNQFRYTMPALPGLLVIFAMVLSDVPVLDRLIAPRPMVALVVMTLVALGPAVVLARQARSDGLASADVTAAAARLFQAALDPSDSMLIVYAQTPQILASAARPRMILYVADAYTRDEFRRLLDAFPARWILAPDGAAALGTLGIDPDSRVGTIDGMDGRWGLFRLPALDARLPTASRWRPAA